MQGAWSIQNDDSTNLFWQSQNVILLQYSMGMSFKGQNRFFKNEVALSQVTGECVGRYRKTYESMKSHLESRSQG